MSIWYQISRTFWSPSFWLPPNITWDDVAPGSRRDIIYARYTDLLWSLPIAIALFTLRYCSEKYIFSAFGQWLGMKSTHSSKRPKPNRILEAAYNKCSRLNQKMVIGLTKQMDTNSMTEREIERWWRLRQAQDKPSALHKFCESAWRCLYYSCSFSLGLYVHWDKPWLWDIEQVWLNYPHHSIDNGVWLYAVMSLSLYCTLIVSQFFDVKRNDFWLLFVHHIVTVAAISLCWIAHFHQTGLLVLLYHDFADIFMEAGKMAKYAKYHKLCNFIMVLFMLAWVGSRLIFYPRLVYSSLIEALRFGLTPMVRHIINIILLLLQCMHILWTYMIFNMAYRALKVGAVGNDCRSSDSDSELLSIDSENRGNMYVHRIHSCSTTFKRVD